MSRLFEALESAADGAFAVDDELRINFWNGAAEENLGFSREDVFNQVCYKILQGHDEGGQLICREYCQVAELALNDRPVNSYDIHTRTKFGDRRWFNMSIFAYKMRDQGQNTVIVHLFRDITQDKDEERFFRRVLEIAQRYHDIPVESQADRETTLRPEVLTPREREVLTVLARGNSTREIAELLTISPNTVRNHIQNILNKLQVHSRLEAVTLAIRHGLIDRKY